MNKKIKFVGLHQHSHYSVFDGFGHPREAINFAIENGSEALALTDHGTMAGLADQVMHVKGLAKKGVDFKPIYGIEAYYHPSISDWQTQYEEDSKGKKKTKKEKEAELGSVVVEDEAEMMNTSATGYKLRHRRHMVLLAQNQTGLNNLFTMISKSYTRPYYYFYPRIDLELLKKHSEGIVATSACMGGLLGLDYFVNKDAGEHEVKRAMRKTVESMMDVYGDNFYGELQWNALQDQHIINKHIIDLHHEYKFELISTADAHFPSPEHWKNREIYKKLSWIGQKEKVSEIPDTFEEMDYQLYPKNGEQMWDSYKNYSEKMGYSYDDKLILDSIERTHDISFSKIEKFYPDNSVKLPSFISEVEDYDAQLRKLSYEQLVAGGLDTKQEYVNRVEKELEVIIKKGFSRYFVTTKIMVDIAREIMLIGAGRGSGGGSLVSFLMNIDDIDPLRWDLQFERFLRIDDDAYPDIDVDIEDPMLLKEKLTALWGEDSVAPVSNWVTLKFKSAIKDVSKLYEIPYTEVNDVTTTMMEEAIPKAKAAAGVSSGMYEPSFDECKQYSPSFAGFLAKYPHLEHPIRSMQGAIKSLSRHAGGLIVADNLSSKIPLIRSSDVIQTPWSKDLLEPMGFIKFDLLGLDTLKMFRGCIERILRLQEGIEEPAFEQIREWYEKNLSTDNLDFNSPEVWEVFQQGQWLGTFQFTNRGAQQFCKTVNPHKLVLLAMVTSIFRPGPLEAGVHKDFLKAMENPGSVKYLNDIHKDVVGESLGFCVFQEQIAELAHRLGKDISLDEGNYLRKLFTKKGDKNIELIEQYKEKFVVGCLEKSISQEDAEDLFKKFEYFSGYGFNKCLSGDTIVTRSSGNQYQPAEITIKELFEAQFQTNDKGELTDWAKKLNHQGVQILQKQSDDKIRPSIMKKIVFNGIKDVYLLTLEDNKTVKATSNHKFLTSCGYIELDNLNIGDEIIVMAPKDPPYIRKGRDTKRAIGKTYDGEGFPLNDKNPSYIDGRAASFEEAKIKVYARSGPFCESCAKAEKGRFEYAHIDSLTTMDDSYNKYHSADNIKYLCNSCHKKLDYKKGERVARWTKGRASITSKVKSIEYCGKERVYDVCMKGPSHNFIANGIVSHNSHAVSYGIISYQCAYLWKHYPTYWAAAYLDCTKKNKLDEAIVAVRSNSIEIETPNINKSSKKWEVGEDGKLYQPLTAINGIADAFYSQIEPHRPFYSIEEMLFHEEMKTPNKSALSALIRAQALNDLMDNRFTGLKHFWSAVAVDKPKNLEALLANIDNPVYRAEGDFSKEEKILLAADLTKMYPLRMVVTEKAEEIMRKFDTLPVSEWHGTDSKYWFVTRNLIEKKDRRGKMYYLLEAIDSSFKTIRMKCWGVRANEDIIIMNRLYVADHIEYSEQWGYSTGWKNPPRHNFRIVS